jgi:hypothetical protein
MSVSRLAHITQIGVEQMGDLADSLNDPNVLRLENLDTDLRPPKSAVDFTKQAADDDDANSYLPFLIDVSPLGLDGPEASQRLLELGQIAATPMVNWGTVRSSNYVRIVFSNEPVQRLQGIGQRFKQALT